MIKKPEECCGFGTYGCSTVMPLNGRMIDVDLCISDIVAALNANSIRTTASCCGHGRIDGDIRLEDGRVIKIKFPKEVAEE